MSITLWAPIVDALVTRINSTLTTHIDAVNVERAEYPIQYPQAVLDYIPTIAELSTLPCIGISDGQIELEDDTGWGATGVATFSLVVFLQSQDQRELVWSLRKYATALTRCVIAGRTLPPEGWSVTVVGVAPGPTLGRDESPRQWLSTVGLRIRVKWEQDT